MNDLVGMMKSPVKIYAVMIAIFLTMSTVSANQDNKPTPKSQEILNLCVNKMLQEKERLSFIETNGFPDNIDRYTYIQAINLQTKQVLDEEKKYCEITVASESKNLTLALINKFFIKFNLVKSNTAAFEWSCESSTGKIVKKIECDDLNTLYVQQNKSDVALKSVTVDNSSEYYTRTETNYHIPGNVKSLDTSFSIKFKGILAIGVVIGILLIAATPKRDKRYKTGFKNNQTPNKLVQKIGVFITLICGSVLAALWYL